MRGKFEVPPGLVAEKTLRSMIRTIADKLKKSKLSVKQTLALLHAQERLSDQLRQTAKARMEIEARQAHDSSGIHGVKTEGQAGG